MVANCAACGSPHVEPKGKYFLCLSCGYTNVIDPRFQGMVVTATPYDQSIFTFPVFPSEIKRFPYRGFWVIINHSEAQDGTFAFFHYVGFKEYPFIRRNGRGLLETVEQAENASKRKIDDYLAGRPYYDE